MTCDVDEAAALELMDHLTAKSLVMTETAADLTRYRFLVLCERNIFTV
jgi:hypothetical protein